MIDIEGRKSKCSCADPHRHTLLSSSLVTALTTSSCSDSAWDPPDGEVCKQALKEGKKSICSCADHQGHDIPSIVTSLSLLLTSSILSCTDSVRDPPKDASKDPSETVDIENSRASARAHYFWVVLARLGTLCARTRVKSKCLSADTPSHKVRLISQMTLTLPGCTGAG